MMTRKVQSLRITDEWVNRRCLIHVDGKRVWVQGACRDAIGVLSLSDEFTPAERLNANPGLVTRGVYKWEKEIRAKLFENNRKCGWRLVIPVETIEWEREFGRVPLSPQKERMVSLKG